MSKNFKLTCLLLSFTLVGLTSCTKDPISDISDEESLVYITNFDKSADFKEYKTFSIVDSVLLVDNNKSQPVLTDIDRDLLEGLIQNMQSLGYTYVSPNANPDVGITASWISNTYLSVTSTPYNSYWGNYYGGYGGGYGGYGYGSPSYYQYSQTTESYWLISMLDFKNPDTTNKTFNVIWNAQIQGFGIDNTQLISKMTSSIFAQSPYLKK
tara:strand:+ start:298 stop:930 length:633 start_codon:yes stop_codon:yes gene_type:complete